MAIMSTILIGTISIFLAASHARIKNKNIFLLKQTGNYALDFVQRKVHNAVCVVANGTEEKSVFITEPGSADPAILWCDTTNQTLFYDTQALTTKDSNITLPACRISVTAGTDCSRQTTLVVSFTLSVNDYSETFNTTVSLRNYQ